MSFSGRKADRGLSTQWQQLILQSGSFYVLVGTRNEAIQLIVEGGRRNHHPAASERNPYVWDVAYPHSCLISSQLIQGKSMFLTFYRYCKRKKRCKNFMFQWDLRQTTCWALREEKCCLLPAWTNSSLSAPQVRSMPFFDVGKLKSCKLQKFWIFIEWTTIALEMSSVNLFVRNKNNK